MKNEMEFLKTIQTKYNAQEIRITELEQFDTVVKNSIHICFVNAMYNLEDSTNHNKVSKIIDSIIHILNNQYKYHLIYSKAAVSFKQEVGFFFHGKSQMILKYHDIVQGLPNMELYINRQIIFNENVNRLNKQGKTDSIKYLCKKIPETDSLYLSALSILGQLAGRQLDTASFIYYFTEMRKIQKKDEAITITLAKAYADKMQYEIAKKYIDTTLSINNRNAYAYYYRGLYEFYTSNKKKKVIADMEKSANIGLEDAKLFLENIEKYYPEK